MAFNNGFPVTYPQYYPYQQNYQPQFQQQGTQSPANPGMTPPTVHADIVQIADEKEGTNYPVAAGVSQMMITKDEKIIMVKTAYPNGQATIRYFDERPPAPPEKPIDLTGYVTKEELERRLAALENKEVEA